MLPWQQTLQLCVPTFLESAQRKELPPHGSIGVGHFDSRKNLLGGWSARGSEQYNRLAKYKIAQIQREVVKRIWDQDAQDPLSETDTLREFVEFFRTQLIDETEISRTIRLLSSRRYVETERPVQIELAPVGIQLEETLEVDDDLVKRSPEEIINEKRQAWNKEKTRKLGDDPKKYRAELRASTRFLHLHFSQEEDPDGSPIGPMPSDTWVGLSTIRVFRYIYAPTRTFRTYLYVVCKMCRL